MDNLNVIEFYGRRQKYFEFSNFSRYRITLDGHEWQTTEHYFQANKFVGTHHYFDIMMAVTPSKAAAMGRDRSKPLRPDWEEVKEKVMLDCLRAKFTQNKELGELLIGTGDAILVEASPVDSYWGSGKDGKGKNRLGNLLMQLREELKQG